MKNMKKALCLFLALVMCLGMLPVSVLADTNVSASTTSVVPGIAAPKPGAKEGVYYFPNLRISTAEGTSAKAITFLRIYFSGVGKFTMDDTIALDETGRGQVSNYKSFKPDGPNSAQEQGISFAMSYDGTEGADAVKAHNNALANLLTDHLTVTLTSDRIDYSIQFSTTDVPDGYAYNPDNGHYYTYEYAKDENGNRKNGITWETARRNARGMTHDFNGLTATGYLTTITTAEEQAFIQNLFKGQFWTAGTRNSKHYKKSDEHPSFTGSFEKNSAWNGKYWSENTVLRAKTEAEDDEVQGANGAWFWGDGPEFGQIYYPFTISPHTKLHGKGLTDTEGQRAWETHYMQEFVDDLQYWGGEDDDLFNLSNWNEEQGITLTLKDVDGEEAHVFNRWAKDGNGSEPNHTGDERYMHVYEHGGWNDYVTSNESIVGYLVEFSPDASSSGEAGTPQAVAHISPAKGTAAKTTITDGKTVVKKGDVSEGATPTTEWQDKTLPDGAKTTVTDSKGNPVEKITEPGRYTVVTTFEDGNASYYSIKYVDVVDLTVEKEADKEVTKVGDTVTYTITVTNNGPDPVAGVKLKDEFSGNGGNGALTWEKNYNPTTTEFDVPAKDANGKGGTKVFKATYVVQEADEGNIITNTAVQHLKDDDPNEPVPTPPQTEVSVLKVTKTVDKETPKAGETITYTITVTNSGSKEATDVTLKDFFVGATGDLVWVGANPADSFKVPARDADGDGKVEFKATYVVLKSDEGKTITNSAVLKLKNDPKDPEEPEEPQTTVTVINPDLTISKTRTDSPNNAPVKVGDTLTYTITVRNNGAAAATNVVVTEVPVNLTIVSVKNGEEAITANTDGGYAIGDLNAGTSVVLNVTATVEMAENSDVSDMVSNQAKVNWVENTKPNPEDPDSPLPGEPKESEKVETEIAKPGLAVEKTHDENATYKAGDTITWTITVTNTGNVELTELKLTDSLDGVTVSAPEGVNAESFALAAGDSVKFTATIADIEAGKTYTNVATVTDKDDKELGKDTDEVEVQPDDPGPVDPKPSLTVEKTHNENATYKAGDTITWTITVTNNGDEALTGLKLIDSLDNVDVTAPEDVNADSFDLAAGESVKFTATLKTTEADQYTNVAVVTDKDGKELGKDTDEVEVQPDDPGPVDPKPGLTVEKTHDESATYKAGDTIEWTITVTNNGEEDLAGLKLTDYLEGVTLADADGVSAESFDLTVGGKVEFTATLANIEAGKTYANLAVVTDKDGKVLDEDTDEVVVPPTDPKPGDLTPSVSVTKEVVEKEDGTSYAAGDTIEWTITVENTGNVDLQDLTLADDLAGVTIDPEGPFNLAVGDTKEFTATVTAEAGKTYTNRVEVRTEDGKPLDEDTADPVVIPPEEPEQPENPDDPAKVNITVTYHPNGGYGEMDNDVQAVEEGSEATFTVKENGFQYTGKKFNGWKTEDGMDYTVGQEVTTGTDLVLYAQWIDDAGYTKPEGPADGRTVTLTYMANGGVGEMPSESKNVEAGKKAEFTVKDSAFTRPGYKFDGWNDKADGSGNAYKENGSVSTGTDLALYAQWVKDENKPGPGPDQPEEPTTYTVTYTDGVEGSVIFTDQIYTVEEGSATPAFTGGTPTRSGYTFTGWSPVVEPTVTDNVTYVAQWRYDGGDDSPSTPTYTLSYNANGGTGAPNSQSGNGSITLRSGAPTREGYTFEGWATSRSATEAAYQPGDIYNLTRSATLYAVWSVNVDDNNTPTTDIPDENPPLANVDDKLNTTDHFAYVVGYPDGEVKPEQNITRAEAVTVFFRLLTDEYRSANWSTENPYPDVESGDWFNNAISTATKAGIFKGDSEGTARPDDPITRAEFAALAARFIGDQITDDGTGDFADTVGHWAAKEIRLAAKAGWITGVGGGKFEPDRNITRAEVMTMVNRMLDRVPDKDNMRDDMIKWPDNMDTSAWYYEAVQEATNGHDYERLEGSLTEKWTELQEPRDWAALEKEWSTAQSGK